VSVLPELKLVMMKSSKLRENARSAAAPMPGQQQREGHPPERGPGGGVEVGRGLLEVGVERGHPSLDRDDDEADAEHDVGRPRAW
jgi:hypothetical protein